jgi:hypothetical protein
LMMAGLKQKLDWWGKINNNDISLVPFPQYHRLLVHYMLFPWNLFLPTSGD